MNIQAGNTAHSWYMRIPFGGNLNVSPIDLECIQLILIALRESNKKKVVSTQK